MHLRYVKQEDFDNLVLRSLPSDVEDLYIDGDFVPIVRVPEGIESITIHKCGVRELHLPDSIKRIYVDGNLLHRLELPQGIEIVRASNNYITEIVFRGGQPTNLEQLYMKDNRIRRFDFEPPECMWGLDIRNNYHIDYISPALSRLWNSIDELTIDNR